MSTPEQRAIVQLDQHCSEVPSKRGATYAHAQHHTPSAVKHVPPEPPSPLFAVFVCSCAGKPWSGRGFKGRFIKVTHNQVCKISQGKVLGKFVSCSFLSPISASDPAALVSGDGLVRTRGERHGGSGGRGGGGTRDR